MEDKDVRVYFVDSDRIFTYYYQPEPVVTLTEEEAWKIAGEAIEAAMKK
jgi:hypothetical protein